MNTLRYVLGVLMSLPFLPIMFWQAKNIYRSVPRLGEADLDREGLTGAGKPSFRLLTIGESTVAGVGVGSHKEGLTGALAYFLAQQLAVNIQWEVVAKNGVTACKTTELLLPKITKTNNDLIVIGLGANDAFHCHSPRRWKKDILALITNIRKDHPNQPIVFLTMPPIKEFPAFSALIQFFIGNLVELLGQELAAITADLPNVWYYHDVFTFDDWRKKEGITETDKSLFFSDGVHPAGITYQIWGRKTGEYILDNVPLLKQNQLI